LIEGGGWPNRTVAIGPYPRRRFQIDNRRFDRGRHCRGAPHLSQVFEPITPFGDVDQDALRVPIEQSGRAWRGHRKLHNPEIPDATLNGRDGRKFPDELSRHGLGRK
jgi:hypothetical protein